MWELCNGGLENSNDCLAEKGFSVAEHEIAEGIFLDVYNLHMDAGGGEDDEAARDAQIDQLLAFIDARPARAIVVAGDTNLSHDIGAGDSDEARLARLLDESGLTDACQFTGCDRPTLIDRVFIRSSDELELTIDAWRIDDALVDEEGEPLSDHNAVSSTISWREL